MIGATCVTSFQRDVRSPGAETTQEEQVHVWVGLKKRVPQSICVDGASEHCDG